MDLVRAAVLGWSVVAILLGLVAAYVRLVWPDAFDPPRGSRLMALRMDRPKRWRRIIRAEVLRLRREPEWGASPKSLDPLFAPWSADPSLWGPELARRLGVTWGTLKSWWEREPELFA